MLPESTTHTSIDAIGPLPTASMQGKKRKRKSHESRILTATAYNTFVEKRKKEKERTQKKVN
jgi:hypothetical protein